MCKQKYLPEILLVGLDGAGKTELIRNLKKEPLADDENRGVKSYICKIGRNSKAEIYDFDGNKDLRMNWLSYLETADALIFMVDSGDVQRLTEARSELTKICGKLPALNTPIMVMANKQDDPIAIRKDTLGELFGLRLLMGLRPWDIQATSNSNKKTYKEALRKLKRMIYKSRKLNRKFNF